MVGQKIVERLKEENTTLGKVQTPKYKGQAVTPMIDKIIGRCKADRKAIELLDDDQKEYLRRNAKSFLAARMKKMKKRGK